MKKIRCTLDAVNGLHFPFGRETVELVDYLTEELTDKDELDIKIGSNTLLLALLVICEKLHWDIKLFDNDGKEFIETLMTDPETKEEVTVSPDTQAYAYVTSEQLLLDALDDNDLDFLSDEIFSPLYELSGEDPIDKRIIIYNRNHDPKIVIIRDLDRVTNITCEVLDGDEILEVDYDTGKSVIVECLDREEKNEYEIYESVNIPIDKLDEFSSINDPYQMLKIFEEYDVEDCPYPKWSKRKFDA